MTTDQLLIMSVIFALGAIVQGIAGMGYGMVVVPVMSLMIGSANGVLWGNITGIITALMLAITKWRDIEWKKVGVLVVSSFPAVLLTTWLLSHLHSGWLDVLVGSLMVAIVIFSLVALRFPPVHGVAPLAATGFVSGMLSATVAQSGPVLAAYAQASRWKQINFAASLQPYFIVLNMVVVPSKLFNGLGSVETLTPAFLLVAFVMIVAGSLIARPLSRIIPFKVARGLALTVAAVGATMILIRGIGSFM